MNSPFTPGDEIYHSVHGKCLAETIANPQYVLVRLENGTLESACNGLLSFDPWEMPNHTRPYVPKLFNGDEVAILPIYMICKLPTSSYIVSNEDRNTVYTACGKAFLKSENTFFKKVLF